MACIAQSAQILWCTTRWFPYGDLGFYDGPLTWAIFNNEVLGNFFLCQYKLATLKSLNFKPRYVSKNLLKKSYKYFLPNETSYKYFLPNETIQQHFLFNNFSIFSTTRNVLKNWKFKKELKLWFLLTLTLVNFWPNPLKSFWKNCKLKSWATLLIDCNSNSIKKPCLPREKFFRKKLTKII